MAITYQGNKNGTAFTPTVSKPIDVREVVDSIEDLTNRSIPNLYQGLVVNIKGTADLYVLTTNALLANKMESWKKIGQDIDLSDYVRIEDLPDYLTDSEVAELATKSDLEDYVKKSDLPDGLNVDLTVNNHILQLVK